jgi:hypothetical protein
MYLFVNKTLSFKMSSSIWRRISLSEAAAVSFSSSVAAL